MKKYAGQVEMHVYEDDEGAMCSDLRVDIGGDKTPPVRIAMMNGKIAKKDSSLHKAFIELSKKAAMVLIEEIKNKFPEIEIGQPEEAFAE